MSPDELRNCVDAIGWSQRALAAVLYDGDRGAVRDLMHGDEPIPEDVAQWLRRLARFHQANPPPVMVLEKRN